MIIVEEGISDKSFVISMVSTALGFVAMVTCLQLFTEQTSNWIQLPAAAGTVALFLIGFAAWAGKFDKKKPVIKVKEEVLLPPPTSKKEVKPAPKEDWTEKWLKENT